jgi:Cdc6-like AAA superfamily ATPase
MLEDFGVAKTATTHAQRLFALNGFLIERRRVGQNTILILDEAQNLDPPTLEQVRLLSNFETPTEKLLQILLVGQPELGAKLQLPQLRQLKQRIGLRCSIRPLTSEQTGDYIWSRMKVGGARDPGLFTERAVGRISEYAGGIPRVINIVCDHCLLFGYADQKRKIDRDIVEQAIKYIEEGSRGRRQVPGGPQPRWVTALRWVLGILAVTPLGWVALLVVGPDALGNVPTLAATYLRDLIHSVRDLLVR